MAKRVTTEDIQLMNEIYYKYKSYAEVACRTGWSTSTVSKYVDKIYEPVAAENARKFDLRIDLPEFSTDIFQGDWAKLCEYTEEEESEIVELWEELTI
jgi:hypothetical protein